MAKNRKNLTPRERLKNLTDASAEDALRDASPLTKEEEAEAERVKKKLLEKVEAETWQEKEAKRKRSPKKKYLN